MRRSFTYGTCMSSSWLHCMWCMWVASQEVPVSLLRILFLERTLLFVFSTWALDGKVRSIPRYTWCCSQCSKVVPDPVICTCRCRLGLIIVCIDGRHTPVSLIDWHRGGSPHRTVLVHPKLWRVFHSQPWSLHAAHLQLKSKTATLTAHNWQKWKRVFLTCPCHEIYRDEAVGLKSCKYTWKITIFVKMWNLGQYRENLIFCQ